MLNIECQDGMEQVTCPVRTKRESVVNIVSNATHMFLVVNVVIDIRRMLQMSETKPKLFKFNNGKTRTKCKICSKLTIMASE